MFLKSILFLLLLTFSKYTQCQNLNVAFAALDITNSSTEKNITNSIYENSNLVPKLYSSNKVEVLLDDILKLNVIEDAIYLPQANVIKFVSKLEIKFIQVFNANSIMIYQLPVRSKKVSMSKSLFIKGTYRLGFIFKDGTEITYANITLN